MAIETPVSGTTRDRLFAEVSWRGQVFNVLDVAGVEFGNKTEIEKNIQEGVDAAIENADVILFLVDWTEKGNDIDRRIAARLRKSKKPVILVVNKADNLERMQNVEEFKRFGEYPLAPISAISGIGSGDLLDMIAEKLKMLTDQINEESVTDAKKGVKLAIVGRPNVGKSTLINTIVGEKRAVVSAEAGTTRDIIKVDFFHKGEKIELIDTAGIRRRGKIVRDTIESFALLRTYRALREADIAVLLIDAAEGLVANDAHILGQVKEWGKGIVLAVNKIDLWEEDAEKKKAQMIFSLQNKLNFVPWLPLVFISAQSQENISPLLNQVARVIKNRRTIISENDLQTILEFAKNSNAQLTGLTSLRQKKTNPPIFELRYKGKKPHPTQIRYFENKIRDSFPMEGSPIFIDLTASKSRR